MLAGQQSARRVQSEFRPGRKHRMVQSSAVDTILAIIMYHHCLVIIGIECVIDIHTNNSPARNIYQVLYRKYNYLCGVRG